MNPCPLIAYGFHFCDIGHHAVSDASKCLLYNRTRLAYEEQKASLLNIPAEYALNFAALRRNQMIGLDLTESTMKRSQAEKAFLDEVMRKRMQKAYTESLVK